MVREALRGSPAATVEIAELLVSELVTNAVVHAGSALIVEVHVAGGRITVTVEDTCSISPGLRRDLPDDDATHGRGMLLVATLARSWGCEETGTGKRMWFELS
jgi:anti-sigma regulatory factor (Ser/Thr protein kinase)